MSDVLDSIFFFDRDAEYRVIDRRLPHWSQMGVLTFITWRTCDSMPKAVLDRWRLDRNNWLQAHNIDPHDPLWREKAIRLELTTRKELLDIDWSRWQNSL